jgi:hypothetical protein
MHVNANVFLGEIEVILYQTTQYKQKLMHAVVRL